MTFKHKIQLAACLFVALAPQKTQAQQALPINLQTVLELAGANNLTIKEFQTKQALVEAELTTAKSWWLPEAYAGAQTHQLWGAAMNADGRFFLDVNRQSLWAGVGLNANWNFGEGIYRTKAAKLQAQAATHDTEAERNKAILESIHAYYDFLGAQMKRAALADLVAQSDTIAEQIEIQVVAGLRYQSELLLAKSNQKHLKIEMLNAQSDFNRKVAELVRLLNLDPKARLVSVDTLLLPLDFEAILPETSDDVWQNRPEIKSVGLSIRSLQTERKTTTTGLLLPQLSIGTYGSYFGRINGAVSPMFPDQYPETNQLYPTGTLNTSLHWNIPLGRLIYGGEVKQFDEKIKLQEVKSGQLHAQINAEIANARQQLLIGREQIQIAKEALELTAEALRQSIERQKLGTARPFEVFQAQQIFLQAHLDYLNAVIAFNKAQFALKVAMGEGL
ncbi:MAG: TolC family protein [Haliscomenobacteraceae bacterium CHB4]|nr:hypothetical protein [Saprospiraceae bacterium]MCE7922482.1 TolC family protein [Haliscomenobacteraceae bacterium CHB4]